MPELHNNLGKALRASGDVSTAIEAHERALSLRPDDADAHWNLALMSLLSGQLERGWEESNGDGACRSFNPPGETSPSRYGPASRGTGGGFCSTPSRDLATPSNLCTQTRQVRFRQDNDIKWECEH